MFLPPLASRLERRYLACIRAVFGGVAAACSSANGERLVAMLAPQKNRTGGGMLEKLKPHSPDQVRRSEDYPDLSTRIELQPNPKPSQSVS
jgi:hypothetical protein